MGSSYNFSFVFVFSVIKAFKNKMGFLLPGQVFSKSPHQEIPMTKFFSKCRNLNTVI